MRLRCALPMLLGLPGFVFQQFAGTHVEHVAQGFERHEVYALGPTGRLHQPVRRGDGEGAIRELLKPIRGFDPARLHEFRQSYPHIQHDTNVSTLSVSSNSETALAYMFASV